MPESQRRPHARDPSPAASLAARGLPTLYQPKRRPPPADRDSSPAEPSTPRSPRPSDVHRRGAGRAGHATRLPPRRWRRARPHHAHRPKRRPPAVDRDPSGRALDGAAQDELDDGLWSVYFYDVLLARFDEPAGVLVP